MWFIPFQTDFPGFTHLFLRIFPVLYIEDYILETVMSNPANMSKRRSCGGWAPFSTCSFCSMQADLITLLVSSVYCAIF